MPKLANTDEDRYFFSLVLPSNTKYREWGNVKMQATPFMLIIFSKRMLVGWQKYAGLTLEMRVSWHV